jgi:hypothetical protein
MSEHLDQLVDEYLAEHVQRLRERLDFFKALGSIEEVIDRAPEGRGADGKMHPHQHNVGYEICRAVAKKLLVRKSEIESCTSFEELIRLVEESRVYRFGELSIYDCALRIGSALGVLPTKVHLHSGAAEGYRKLTSKSAPDSVTPEELPEAVRRLPPHEIEDFLCIFSDSLLKRQSMPAVGKCVQMPKRKRGCDVLVPASSARRE